MTDNSKTLQQGNPFWVPFCRCLVVVFLLLWVSCAPEDQVITVNSSLQVQGAFSFGEDVQPVAGISGFYVDTQGRRYQIPGYTLANGSSNFAFPLDLGAMIIRNRWRSPPEVLAAMGQIPPSDDIQSQQLGKKPIGFLRLELYGADLTGNAGTVPYFKAHLPVERTKTFAVDGTVQLGSSETSGIKLEEVGYLKVQVVDPGGMPIPTAEVSVVPLKPVETIIGQGIPLTPWDSGLYGSVGEPVNANGEAYALPIPANFPVSRFQIIARADNYCIGISDQANFDPADYATEPLRIVLDPCPDDDKEDFSYSFDFGDTIKKFPLDSEPETIAGYTNQKLIPLTLAATGKSLRGMVVRVYDYADVKGLTELDDIAVVAKSEADFPTFSENYTLDITALTAGVTSGRFVVVVTPKGEPRIPSQAIQGIFAIANQPTDKSYYQVTAVTGALNTVPLSQTSFTVTLNNKTRCVAGEELGLYFGIAPQGDATFKPCSTGTVSFSTSEMKSAASLKSNGMQKLTFVRKDRYGNISPRPKDQAGNPTDSDRLEIYVDATVPSLEPVDGIAAINYNIDFGIAPLGTDQSNPPYLFPPNPLVITPNTVGDFAVIFASAQNCQLDEEDKEGDAHKIFDYRLVTSATLATAPYTDARLCDGSTEFALNSQLVSFPSETTEPATFNLQVRDRSGQISSPKTFSIPACSVDNSKTCWQP